MAAALDPLPIPHRRCHKVGLDFLTHLLVSTCFDSVLVVVDHFTRMAHLFPCTEGLQLTASKGYKLQLKKRLKSFHKVCAVCMAFRVCWLVIETRDMSTHSYKHFGNA
jgi:hypothetical protein